MQGNIFIEHTIKYSCWFKYHLEMALGHWMLRLTVLKKMRILVPEIVISKPECLPDRCTGGKCACKNGCCCRVAGIECCMYC